MDVKAITDMLETYVRPATFPVGLKMLKPGEAFPATCHGVDAAREVLVDERAHRIDVAKNDAVERVVQHEIEAFQRAHGRDLRHAETGAVIHEAHVAMKLGLQRV